MKRNRDKVNKLIAEIITIGTELITGTIDDSNSSFLARQLARIGIEVIAIQSVGDSKKDIVKALEVATQRAKFIITTGGLGPTDDDLTKAAVAEFLNLRLIYNQDLESDLIKFYGDKLTQKHKDQACLPEGSEYLKTDLGSAPGFIYSSDEFTIMSLPGVPYELVRIFKTTGIAMIKARIGLGKSIERLMFRTFGLFETEVEEMVRESANEYGLSYSILAGAYGVDLFIDRKSDEKLNKMIIERIKFIFKENLYAFGDSSLAEIVGRLLKEKNQTLAIAESCTGGLLSSMITSIPGSSDYFLGSLVVYQNKLKKDLLDISDQVINVEGAVSKTTARLMAKNVKQKTGADWGISITGIAGPSGGTTQKPIGLVYTGISGRKGEIVEKYSFFGDRRVIQERAAYNALNNFRLLLIERD